MKLEDKVAFITGANGGLGRAFVKELLNQNVKKIYCAVRDTKSLDEINKLSSKIEVIALDITNKHEVQKVASTIENIDILINNAGVNSGKRVFDETKIDFEVNLFGTLNSCQILGNKVNTLGAIVNITSILALINLPVMGLYCASKSALHSLTQALRVEFNKKQVEVYEVLPGPIDTNMTKGQDLPKTQPSDIVNEVIKALENSQYEIYPDGFSKMVKERLISDKELLEKEFAQSINY
ncbi:SDR family NAD(P)-dependent oxidoreductase [Malaciobacter mytili]|uniref:SDR family NAD(P)-dependent oxidoreductase n=1 Tax=Malaciobacter mytili TaxID=603050 RepID=UPI003BAF5337